MDWAREQNGQFKETQKIFNFMGVLLEIWVVWIEAGERERGVS